MLKKDKQEVSSDAEDPQQTTLTSRFGHLSSPLHIITLGKWLAGACNSITQEANMGGLLQSAKLSCRTKARPGRATV